ncbi:MAG TPA: hypothetical protein VM223_21555 [Planctomycetota bacterium]|nr:hypothetical protein [Planctomycetota bacterium]
MNAAANGDTIILLDGTYTGLGNRDIDFAGKQIATRSAADTLRASAFPQ